MSFSGSSSVEGATNMQVATVYSDASCMGTPMNMYVSPTDDCEAYLGSAAGECFSDTYDDGTTEYFYTYECSSDARATMLTNFMGHDFFGVDVYTSDCAEYSFTNVYLAVGTCEPGFQNSSAIANVYQDGNGDLTIFWTSTNCSAATENDYTNYSPTADQLVNGTCTINAAADEGYIFFTSSSLEGAFNNSGSSSTGSSTPTPSTPAPTEAAGHSTGLVVGIAVGAVAAVLIVAGLIFWFCRRKRTYNRNEPLLDPSTGKLGTLDIMTEGLTTGYLTGEGGAPLWDDEAIVSSRVPREKVTLEKLLSRGGYGEVYKGTYNGMDVAVKMLLPETRRSLKHVAEFLAEVKMIAALEHEHIVQFIGVAWDSLTDLCVLLEFMHGGDLRNLLAGYEESGHPRGFDYNKVKIAYHVAHALTYLHTLEQPVIHRDLKSKNVLLSNELDAKLTDFGISRERADRTMTAGVGTSLWMAPEVMMGERYDTAADMFSFGVLLSELDVQSLPYSHAKENSNTGRRMPDAAILQMVAMGTLRVEFSSGSLPAVVELGLACVATEPTSRPTAPEALYKLQTILRNDF